MRTSLILYVGTDFLVPVIATENNDLFRYNSNGDSRMWLYFREDPDTTDVLYGQDNYQSAQMGKPSYFGAYWEQVGSRVRTTVQGVETDYVNLPRIAGMLRDLTQWFRSITNKTGTIRTVCLFDDHIGHPARKAFIEMLGADNFEVASYSVSFNSLLAAYCNREYRQVTMGYGRQAVVVEASGKQITISSMIYWNDRFVGCNEPLRIPFEGENPVKLALVKHIVDTNNRENGFLRPEQLQTEYRYQLQFADEWMKQAAAVPDDESLFLTYHLSMDPDRRYSLNIKKSFLIRQQEESVRSILDAIDKYCHNIAETNIAQYIFTGEIFASDTLRKLVLQRAQSKSIYVSSSKYPDILQLYAEARGDLTEPVKQYDKVIAARESERNAATVWFEEAERMLATLEAFQRQQPQLTEKVNLFAGKVKMTTDNVRIALESSQFDQAAGYLDELRPGISEIQSYIAQSIQQLLEQHQCNQNLYEKIAEFGYANDIIGKIDLEAKAIVASCAQFGELLTALDEWQTKIGFYRDNYELYRQLRRKFDEATSLIEKQKLLKEMRPLTGEVLPEEVTGTAAVKGEIALTANWGKSLFGLVKKLESVNVTVRIGDTPLPYHCVLCIAQNPISQIEPGAPGFELPKGTRGVKSEQVMLPADFGKSKRLFARIFIDKHREMLADISKISFNTCTLTLK